MKFVWVALTAVGLVACAAGPTQTAVNCGAAASQTVAEGGGRGPSCEGPPVSAEAVAVFGASSYAGKLYDSGRQGGDIGHSGRAGVYER